MTQITRRELLQGAAAAGAAATLPAPRAAQAQATQKRELVVAQGGDISKFDPHYSTSSNDIRISFNLVDNLRDQTSSGFDGLDSNLKVMESDCVSGRHPHLSSKRT